MAEHQLQKCAKTELVPSLAIIWTGRKNEKLLLSCPGLMYLPPTSTPELSVGKRTTSSAGVTISSNNEVIRTRQMYTLIKKDPTRRPVESTFLHAINNIS